MAGTDNSQRRGSKEPRRNLRLRLACARCQRRKIRCDGNVPTCNNCKKASVECLDGESVRLGDLPRAQISRLRNRVQWLESIVRSRCPDVDLSQAITDDMSSPVDDSQMTVSSPTEDVEGQSRMPASSRNEQWQSSGLSHEIGLVSLNGSQDPRYIGPSSGHFLARVMLGNRGFDEPLRCRSTQQMSSTDLVEALQGPLPLPPENQAQLLVEHYFEVVHPQYPILHRPTFMSKLMQVLVTSEPDPIDAFQVFMVLGLGAIVASHRRRVRLPGESYCLSALAYFDRLNVENSVSGLQCLLLLSVFTIHCSNIKLNIWYLNYQCIACAVDLGLQRNISARPGITSLDVEMRIRLFWVVLMLDRRLATMMGRPIGLRDEACDLHLPSNADTGDPMTFSIHLFKLTKLNSEIKYVAMSVVRGAPTYAYPAIIDYNEWQTTMLSRLEEWRVALPPRDDSNFFVHTVCEIHHQSLKMVLLRPSPAIPNPSQARLSECHSAALENLRLISSLYRNNLLIQSWDIFYSLVLSAITRMYCIKSVPELAKNTDAEGLLAGMSEYLSILSATGEHWPEAKRCRDILDDLGRTLVKWLKDSVSEGVNVAPRQLTESVVPLGTCADSNNAFGPLPDTTQLYLPNDGTLGLHAFSQEPFDSFPPTGWPSLPPDAENMDAIIRSLFDDFIPDSSDYFNS